MQKNICICISNVWGFWISKIFYGIVEFTPVAMATKSDFQFEFKTFRLSAILSLYQSLVPKYQHKWILQGDHITIFNQGLDFGQN